MADPGAKLCAAGAAADRPAGIVQAIDLRLGLTLPGGSAIGIRSGKISAPRNQAK